jgi:multisubunit Na+/H+ antiporter MnhC subunit
MVVFSLVAVLSAVVIALAVLGFALTLLALGPLLPNGLTTTKFRESSFHALWCIEA